MMFGASVVLSSNDPAADRAFREYRKQGGGTSPTAAHPCSGFDAANRRI